MKHALVEQTDRLVGQTGRQCADLERMPPSRSTLCNQRLRRPGKLVEVVEDGPALDEHLTVVQHQCWHTPEGVQRSDTICIAEG